MDDLAARCHANCIEYARESARGSGPAGEIAELGGILLVASGSEFPILANAAFRLDLERSAEEVIAVADAWFGERRRGWSLGTTTWNDEDQDLIAAAASHGLVTTTNQPAMVCEEHLPEVAVPDGIELRHLSTIEEGLAFVAMADRAYTSLGLPEGVIKAIASDRIRFAPNQVTVGAFEGDAILSGAQVMLSHGIAGIYCVATSEGARGRGLADLVTRTATNIGFDRGASCVTLQASPMGEPIYRRMGYRDLYTYATHTRFA